jgi:hypothetical protein
MSSEPQEIEPGSLWRHHRRGYYVRIEKLVARRGSDWAMVYFQRISGPGYQYPMTKHPSSAVRHWFLKTYDLAEPAVHVEEEEAGAPPAP